MLIIFDLDGVLKSASWEGLFRAYIEVIQCLGKDYRNFFRNLEEFRKWWNPDWHEGCKELGVNDYSTVNEIFYKQYKPYVSIFPWAANVLQQLSKRHLLSILSSNSETIIKESLGARIQYFTLIVGQEQVTKLKPDPEGIRLILRELKATPSEALMIGDLAEDILAGKKAGIKTGAVSWGLGERDDLIKLNPDYLFEKPSDLLFL